MLIYKAITIKDYFYLELEYLTLTFDLYKFIILHK
jgi:hypothetical protein